MGRRSFAASVVVTISLTQLACTPSAGEPTHNPPPPEPEPQQPEVEEEISRNPPDPTHDSTAEEAGEGGDTKEVEPSKSGPEKDLPDATAVANVTQRADGSCWEFDSSFKCPEGATCNPPRPVQVECPPDKKLPAAKNPDRVDKRDNGQCWETFSVNCPPGARCNPPPPRRVMCPDDLEPGK